MYTRRTSVEFSGTSLGTTRQTFNQEMVLLENSRRFEKWPIVFFFGLSSTGLDEQHFRRIFRRVITAVQNPVPPLDPEGAVLCLEMLSVSVLQMYMRGPLHQVDHGMLAWDRANIDRVAADEYCH
jgi:hypothetical protein